MGHSELDMVTKAENAAWRRIECRAEQAGDIEAEMLEAITLGMSGLAQTVPAYRLDRGLNYVEAPSTVADEVMEALEYPQAMHDLLMVLKDSACPLVAKLRRAVADQYIKSNSAGVSQARGL